MATYILNKSEKEIEDVTIENFHLLKNTLTESFMIAVLNADGEIVEINENFSKVFKYTSIELYMQNYWILNSGFHSEDFIKEVMYSVQQGGQWSGELCHQMKNRELIWLKSTIIPFQNNIENIVCYMIVSHDITDQKMMEKWKYLACHSDLTNLPNRRSLNMSMESYILRSKQKRSKLAVLYLDVNEFKTINDRYGHNVGDLLLKEIGDRLANRSALNNGVFHLSGDEFIMIIEDITDLEAEVQSVLDLFDHLFDIEDQQLQLSASIGVSIYPDHSMDGETLIDYADIAMLTAKHKLEKSFKVHQPVE